MSWIDISIAIREHTVHWPDNRPVVVQRTMDMEHGAKANIPSREGSISGQAFFPLLLVAFGALQRGLKRRGTTSLAS